MRFRRALRRASVAGGFVLALMLAGISAHAAPAPPGGGESATGVGLPTQAAALARLAPTTFKEARVAIRPNNIGVASGYVSCPPGTKVVTAGATAASPNLTLITGLTPTFDGNGGYASADFSLIGASPGAVLDVTALCAQPQQLSTVATLPTTVPPGVSFPYVDRRNCPAGKTAFGGGAFFTRNGVIEPNTGISFNTLQPVGNGWHSTSNTVSQPNLAMESSLRCINPLQLGPSVTVFDSEPVVASPTTPTQATAFCPAGHTAYAGGAEWSGNKGILRTSTYSFNRTAWTAQGFGNPGTVLNVTVRCIRTDQQ